MDNALLNWIARIAAWYMSAAPLHGKRLPEGRRQTARSLIPKEFSGLSSWAFTIVVTTGQLSTAVAATEGIFRLLSRGFTGVLPALMYESQFRSRARRRFVLLAARSEFLKTLQAKPAERSSGTIMALAKICFAPLKRWAADVELPAAPGNTGWLTHKNHGR